MKYDEMLKEISEVTALRELMDTTQANLSVAEGQVANTQQEIEKRKALESQLESIIARRTALTKELDSHKAELSKRLGKLEKEGITLPFKETAKPFVRS